MVKLTKTLLVLLAAVLTVGDAWRIRGWPQSCSDILGMQCNENSECACAMSRPNPPLICNYRSRCEEKSPMDDIWRKLKLPCPLIHKSRCMEDADCPCSEALLICEDRECVRAKPAPLTLQ